MSNLILTPKKAQILVPGVGVVQKADFTQDHAKALLKRAAKGGVDQNEFIKQHFEVGVSNLPLFEEEQPEQTTEELKAKRTRKKKESESEGEE